MEATEPETVQPVAPLRERLRAALRPYPFEIFAVVNLLVAVAFLRSYHLRVDGRGLVYITRPLVKSLPYYLALGLVLALVAVLISRRPWRPFLRRRASVGWIVHWLRLWIGIMVVTYAYGWLKVNVPLVQHHLLDPALWRLDVAMHLGVSPSIFAIQLFQGTPLVGVFDDWYNLWITTVMATLCFAAVYLEPAAARRFVFAMLLLWGLGAWLYVALPAVGPMYAYGVHWSDFVMPKALATQADLWRNYQIMLGGRTGQIYSFNPIKGVAAMPSLHVGVHALFALWSRKYLRPLWTVFLLATLLTLVGSVVTGWHYAVDGYVGIALAWVCFRLAERFEGKPRAGESDPDADIGEPATEADDPAVEDQDALESADEAEAQETLQAMRTLPKLGTP